MSNFVPITEIPSLDEAPDSLITWDFQLPPNVDAERVQINMDRIERISKIGYFLGHHVIGYQGEVSNVTPGFSGINPDGTAQASGVANSVKAPVNETSLIDEYPEAPFLMRRYHKTTAIHKLNKAEIVSRVVDRKRDKEVTSEVAWAEELNSAFAGSVRSASTQHLFDRSGNRFFTILDTAALMTMGSLATINLVVNNDVHTMASFGVIMGFRAIIDQGFKLFDRDVSDAYGIPLDNKRTSFTFSLINQADRHLAVSALSRVGPLIRAAK